MNIKELSNKLYEDLNGRITAFDFSDDLTIDFQRDDWDDYDVTRRFKIACREVMESEVQPSESSEVNFTDTHELLWSHNEPHGYLYYSSEPKSRYEILVRVWEAHEQVFDGWRPLAELANTYHAGQLIEFCSGSNGQMARGPKPLMELYQRALAGHIETNYVPSFSPEGVCKVLVSDSTRTCEAVKKSAALNNDELLNISVELDGVSSENPAHYRLSSPDCFDLLGLIPKEENPPKVYPAASDGYWVMLKPLEKGKHVLKFSAQYDRKNGAYGKMLQDIYYEIMVQ